MLTLTEAKIGYPGKTLLSCIDISFSRGETIFLSGPNGSGKSSLAKSILGVLPLISGKRICTFNQIAYVPQSSHFETQYPFNVFDLVQQGLPFNFSLKDFLGRKQYLTKRNDMIMNILHKVQLKKIAGSLLREISGGQLQRALIARAMVSSPDFLLLDEPFSNLDRAGRKDMALLLKEYAGTDTCLCVIDHGDALEYTFYNRVLEIDEGHIMTLLNGANSSL